MALWWDYRDAQRLVALLSPPLAAQEAELALRRVYKVFSRESYRERYEGQPTKQVRKELKTLQRAMSALSSRALNVLAAAIEEGPFLPYPCHRAQLAIATGIAEAPGVRLSGRMALHVLHLATEHALENTS
jgi:hypothetical protein